MTESTVQVPVSLIEQIDRDLGENAWHPDDCPGSHPAHCLCAVGDARRALRALLSPPIPTAAPPSIADMVPGTTFRFEGETWAVADGGDAVRVSAAGWRTYRTLNGFDPSTICDVTPPASAPGPPAPDPHPFVDGRFGDDGICHARVRDEYPSRCYRPRADAVHESGDSGGG